MPEFYDLPDAERIARTEEAIATKSSLLSRWAALGPTEAAPWDGRAAAAAAWLAPNASVADIGCGTMVLERSLKPGTRYVPVDILRRDERTAVCDLNVEALPALDAEAAACLGLLEYLFDIQSVLTALRAQFRACVLSYNTVDAKESCGGSLDGSPNSGRRAHAWVNDLSTAELEALFSTAGWTVELKRELDASQTMWRLV